VTTTIVANKNVGLGAMDKKGNPKILIRTPISGEIITMEKTANIAIAAITCNGGMTKVRIPAKSPQSIDILLLFLFVSEQSNASSL
jgi:hypothetical protein